MVLCGSFIRLNGPREEGSFVYQTARGFLEKYTENSSTADTGQIDMDARKAKKTSGSDMYLIHA